MTRPRPRVIQLVVSAAPGDAIYDQAIMIHDALRAWGYETRIYAAHLAPSLENHVPYFTKYKPHHTDVVLFHYSIASSLSPFVHQLPCRVMLIYHNLTPPDYLTSLSHEMAQRVREGRANLPSFKDKVVLALGDSDYNRQELISAGYAKTDVLPIVLDESKYSAAPNPKLLEQYQNDDVNLLFVGRVTPNKRHDELLKIFCHYHKIQPRSRLFLVGKVWDPSGQYLRWLKGIVSYLGLERAVHFTGHVSFQDLITYYRLADVFLCMSEHEGFGKPLIESMYFDVPIIAYAAAGIPYTLGDAGVLVHEKDYPVIAELVDLLVTDESLRNHLLVGQRERFQAFRESAMLDLLRGYLAEVLS